MAHNAGTAGHVYGNALLVEDCEDVWTTGGAGRAVSVVTGKVGTYAARVTTTTIGATTLLQYEDFASANLSAYKGLYGRVRSSLTTAAGNLQLLLDDTAACATALESLDIPIITAATWRQVFTRFATPANLTAIISVGLYQVADLADGTFDVDDVQALAELAGMRSWTIDRTTSIIDTTDFADVGVRSVLPAVSQWAGSFEGLKDGAPLDVFNEVYLVLGESSTAYRNWIGKAVITGVHASVAYDGAVTYAYTFEGTGALQPPDA